MSFLSRLKKVFAPERKGKAARDLKVDFHSHLLPGIDDGVKTPEQSLQIIRELVASGVEKIITTPHILQEAYPNTPEIIKEKEGLMLRLIRENNIPVRFQAAAEYYMDDHFIRMVKEGQPLLTFSDNYVLVETNYIQSHPRVKEVFFDMKLAGYKPVFAHPERYLYLYHPTDYRQLHDLFDFDIYFQANILSFTGYYGPQIKTLADYMLKNRMIHMIGSDIHRMEHALAINRFKSSLTFEKIMGLGLMNNSL